MKILTKEEEAENYNATLRGGLIGGSLGLVGGGAAVYLLSRRYPTVAGLTLPMKTFLTTSAATFFAITSADKASRDFETRRYGGTYKDGSTREAEAARQGMSTTQRITSWARENRYPIVFGSWVASMGVSFTLVSRNKYLTGAQKLVQARVYAQGLTLAVLIASAALEVGDAKDGKGRWETVKVLDPDDPEHKHMIEKRIHHEEYAGQDLWRDMIEAEEKRMKERESSDKTHNKRHDKSNHGSEGTNAKGKGEKEGK